MFNFLLDKFSLYHRIDIQKEQNRIPNKKQDRYSNGDVHEIENDAVMMMRMIDDDDDFDGIYFHYHFLYVMMKLYDEEMH